LNKKNRPLELCNWIMLAERQGLLATIDEIGALPIGVAVKLVPPEYCKFLLHEYPDKHPTPPANVIVTCTKFFTSLCNSFTRLAGMTSAVKVYHSDDGIKEGPLPNIVGQLVFADGAICERACRARY
jgi:hypothetical protein